MRSPLLVLIEDQVRPSTQQASNWWALSRVWEIQYQSLLVTLGEALWLLLVHYPLILQKSYA